MNRRDFLNRTTQTTLGLAAGMTILSDARSARATPANDKISLAMIGLRARGRHLGHGFLDRGDCRIAYACDVDRKIAASRAKEFAAHQAGQQPKVEQDFRRALEDKSLDAVVVATPDHWHALATIWGCQAGKDVYVEKPASHNPWEGRKMVEAAQKYKRIVQLGTQTRSAPYFLGAKKYIDEGKLGKVHLCRVFNQIPRGNFSMAKDSDPPEGLDWDMWNGPAPEHRYNRTLHRHWNWLWRYSGGDIINNGVHQIDMGRYLCGVTHPKSVFCSGGRFHHTEGAAESPDTQIATFDFNNLILTFELTEFTPYMLKIDGGVRQSDMFPYWMQCSTRVEIYGSEGVMFVGRVGGGWQVFVRTKNRKPVVKDQMYGRYPDPEHKENFVQCIRSRKLPYADILEGHLSTLLCQYANISLRLGGQKLAIDPKTEQIVDNPEAMRLFRRTTYRKPWVVPERV